MYLSPCPHPQYCKLGRRCSQQQPNYRWEARFQTILPRKFQKNLVSSVTDLTWKEKGWTPSSFRSLSISALLEQFELHACSCRELVSLAILKKNSRGSLLNSLGVTPLTRRAETSSRFNINQSTHLFILGLNFITCKIRGVWPSHLKNPHCSSILCTYDIKKWKRRSADILRSFLAWYFW